MSRQAYPIPARLNILLSLFQLGGSIALLSAASHASSLLAFWASVLAFSFWMQMGFSLIHEAEHAKLHPNLAVNDALGVLLSSIFPGSFTFMKTAHLSHHRRNRSDAELVDYIRLGERRGVKYFQYYFLVCGGVWIGTPLLSILIALTPSFLIQRWGGSDPRSGVALYLQFIKESGQRRVRVQTLFSLLFGWWVIRWFGLTSHAIGCAYLAFAFSWSSQQYIYHIRTPRHLVEGASNLRLWWPIELFYLRFNYHLSHHRAPSVPWIHMSSLSAPAQECYWVTYVRIWSPPEPVSKAWPVEFQKSGPLRPLQGS